MAWAAQGVRIAASPIAALGMAVYGRRRAATTISPSSGHCQPQHGADAGCSSPPLCTCAPQPRLPAHSQAQSRAMLPLMLGPQGRWGSFVNAQGLRLSCYLWPPCHSPDSPLGASIPGDLGCSYSSHNTRGKAHASASHEPTHHEHQHQQHAGHCVGCWGPSSSGLERVSSGSEGSDGSGSSWCSSSGCTGFNLRHLRSPCGKGRVRGDHAAQASVPCRGLVVAVHGHGSYAGWEWCKLAPPPTAAASATQDGLSTGPTTISPVGSGSHALNGSEDSLTSHSLDTLSSSSSSGSGHGKVTEEQHRAKVRGRGKGGSTTPAHAKSTSSTNSHASTAAPSLPCMVPHYEGSWVQALNRAGFAVSTACLFPWAWYACGASRTVHAWALRCAPCAWLVGPLMPATY